MRPTLQSKLLRALPLVTATVPTAFIGILIVKFSVDIPQWDQWVAAAFFDKLDQGTLSFHDLFRLQNEYRQFFPNLIFVALGRLTGWDVRYEMLISLLLAGLTSFNIHRLGKATLKDTGPRLWAYLAANLLIFSPVQYENWLQGQQLIYFIPVACLTTCLLIACSSRLSTAAKFSTCGALSLISTFSSANGFLCWLLVLPVLAWPRRELREKVWWLAAWILGFVLCAVLYLYGYRQPSGNSYLFYALTKPIQAVGYFLHLLGRPFTLYRLISPAVVGLGLIGLSTWAAAQFKRSVNEAIDVRPQLVWLILGGYSLISAVLVTLGRATMGLEQSLSSRYTTFTLYLPVALVYLMLMRTKSLKPELPQKRLFQRVPIAAVVVILVQLPMYLIGINWMKNSQVALLQMKACVLLSNAVDEECLAQKVHFDPDEFKPLVNAANRLGLLRPPLVISPRVREIAEPETVNVSAGNSFTEVTQVGAGEYIAAGRAISPRTGQPPDAVLLVYDQGQGEEIIFAIAFPNSKRPLMSTLLGKPVDTNWRRSIATRQLPKGALRLTAWGFDARTGKAYRLPGAHLIENLDTVTVNQ